MNATKCLVICSVYQGSYTIYNTLTVLFEFSVKLSFLFNLVVICDNDKEFMKRVLTVDH